MFKNVADTFVTCLKEDEEVFDQHSECEDCVFIFQIVVVELQC